MQRILNGTEREHGGRVLLAFSVIQHILLDSKRLPFHFQNQENLKHERERKGWRLILSITLVVFKHKQIGICVPVSLSVLRMSACCHHHSKFWPNEIARG